MTSKNVLFPSQTMILTYLTNWIFSMHVLKTHPPLHLCPPLLPPQHCLLLLRRSSEETLGSWVREKQLDRTISPLLSSATVQLSWPRCSPPEFHSVSDHLPSSLCPSNLKQAAWTTSNLSHLESSNTYARILFIDFGSAYNTIHPVKLYNKLFDLNI